MQILQQTNALAREKDIYCAISVAFLLVLRD